jgi:predicted metal-dependent HD superfamily phosphohydrolase
VPAADANPLFEQLVRGYTAEERYYHNLEHVAEMLRVMARLARDCDDPNAVELSVWFHDAVYDPRAKDSEDRSAALAEEHLRALALPGMTLHRVVQLVKATAHLSFAATPADRDTAVLLDADLAILGASDERYRRYAADIRKEYAFVPEADYRAGRAAVLRLFLNRPRIYHTWVMFEEGEVRARANLAAELETLEK